MTRNSSQISTEIDRIRHEPLLPYITLGFLSPNYFPGAAYNKVRRDPFRKTIEFGEEKNLLIMRQAVCARLGWDVENVPELLFISSSPVFWFSAFTNPRNGPLRACARYWSTNGQFTFTSIFFFFSGAHFHSAIKPVDW